LWNKKFYAWSEGVEKLVMDDESGAWNENDEIAASSVV